MDEPKKPFWMPDAQGFTIASIIFICAVCVFWRMTHPSPTDDKLLDMMLTILFSSCLVAIVGYQFGSSRGSAQKDDTQTKIIERLAPPPAPVPPPAPSGGDMVNTINAAVADGHKLNVGDQAKPAG